MNQLHIQLFVCSKRFRKAWKQTFIEVLLFIFLPRNIFANFVTYLKIAIHSKRLEQFIEDVNSHFLYLLVRFYNARLHVLLNNMSSDEKRLKLRA